MTQITFYVYCAWQVKTGYTPSIVLLVHRLVLDYRQQHTIMNRHTFSQLICSYIYGQTKDCFGSTKYYDNIGNYDDDLHPKIPLVILKNKDSNNAVCAHFAWSIQTGYIPPRETPTHRPVPDFENQHASEVQNIINIVNNTYNNYGNFEMLWWCSK